MKQFPVLLGCLLGDHEGGDIPPTKSTKCVVAKSEVLLFTVIKQPFSSGAIGNTSGSLEDSHVKQT